MIFQDARLEFILLLLLIALSFFLPTVSCLLITIFLVIYPIRYKLTYNLILFNFLIYFSLVVAQKQIGLGNDDFAGYISSLANNKFPSWNDNVFDFLFWLLSSIIYPLTNDGKEYIFIASIISFLPLVIFFSKALYLKNNKLENVRINALFLGFFCLLFICSMSFWNLYGNYLRQAWVMSFSLLGLMAITKGKNILALVWATLALITHGTGVIVFAGLAGIIFFRKINIRLIINILLISALLSVIMNPLRVLLPYLINGVANKIEFYLTWQGLSFGTTASYRIMMVAIVLLFINIKFYLFKTDKLLLYMILFLSFYCFISLSVSSVPKAVERLYYPTMIWFYLVVARFFAVFIYRFCQSQPNFTIMNFTVLPILFLFFFVSLGGTFKYNPSYYAGEIENFIFFSPFFS
ncbi:EpsG family protein [Mixta intestinalis]|uniref:Transmembrane protein EpsG n=1 Tax=Mixta intestinalis TaxID=1615494 RepID=A0A6P1PYY5_9GAMM|nr:EpsG family protein [Mixta intestinalis]QHM71583.1 hypothetical protein C7M51_01874 [Mixta intestinalis]